MVEEFNLSEKLCVDYGHDIEDYPENIDMDNPIYIKLEDVKEFIKRQIERIDARILELSEFDGIAEVMLQKAELYKVKIDLINDAGEKLI